MESTLSTTTKQDQSAGTRTGFKEVFDQQVEFFHTQATQPISFRIAQLKKLSLLVV